MGAEPEGANSELEILYRDETLVAINKPAGMLVHRSNIDKHETRFALQTLRDQIGQHVFPVHRLDKPTSGILLFALNSDAAHYLSQQFEAHTIKKHYWLVCRGHPPTEGLIDYPLVPKDDFASKHRRAGKIVLKKPAQEAVTAFTTLACCTLNVAIDKYPQSRYALVEVRPSTGRKHQLRRHFKHISHPIIGDAKYGKSHHNHYFAETLACSRLLLHARGLGFLHPTTREAVSIMCEPSGVFKDVLAQLSLSV